MWRDDERFVESYLTQHLGFYVTGDGGYRDEDGYLFVMGRIDDVINVAGHRLSTGQIEEVLASHPAVAECAVIGVDDALKGQIPRGFVVLKGGRQRRATLSAELVQLVRDQIGPVAALRRVDVVPALPKTRVRQDTPQDHAGDRRRPGRARALDDRERRGPRRAPSRADASRAAAAGATMIGDDGYFATRGAAPESHARLGTLKFSPLPRSLPDAVDSRATDSRSSSLS